MEHLYQVNKSTAAKVKKYIIDSVLRGNDLSLVELISGYIGGDIGVSAFVRATINEGENTINHLSAGAGGLDSAHLSGDIDSLSAAAGP